MIELGPFFIYFFGDCFRQIQQQPKKNHIPKSMVINKTSYNKHIFGSISTVNGKNILHSPVIGL
ncbi:hypothetical protein DERP_006923 [Dermatophagoides pteronyssinus]|uniref:Uncharacterized protein n=1 Tax=Dermatophagoides pteronyssinus TaxID=6956 RepID=A0ABQ8ISD7_DERPT|nr:hypothetical protein DERP_006923 [Dermatophagoides pteronyssinus]